MEKQEPKYIFTEVADGELNPASPIKKKISKTMEVTETFTLFEALQYVARMKKAITDKEAEIDGLKSMVKAYEEEIELIEESLGVQKMEEEYQKALAEEVAKNEADSENQDNEKDA